MSFVLKHRETLTGDDLHVRLAEDPRQAARAILTAAGQGIVEAQLLLGQILLDGRGIEADPVVALSWFRIAAQNGSAMASNMLGRCLEHGWGCIAAPQEAARHYQVAADADLDWGLYNLANLLATGRGVARDDARAFSLYLRAAGMGHAKSMNLVGRFYEDGLVVARDENIAHDWYRRSAEAGDFRGQFSHAAILAEHGNIEQASFWLKRALAEGNLNFLRVARVALLHSPQTAIRELARDYFARAAQLGGAADQQAWQDFLRSQA